MPETTIHDNRKLFMGSKEHRKLHLVMGRILIESSHSRVKQQLKKFLMIKLLEGGNYHSQLPSVLGAVKSFRFSQITTATVYGRHHIVQVLLVNC